MISNGKIRVPLLLALAMLANGHAAAQTQPPDLVPAPEPPPIPTRVQSGESLEPDITIVRREEETVVEYRQNGELRAVKVIPKNPDFPPYYLVDADGDGRLESRRSELTPNIWINSWVLFSW